MSLQNGLKNLLGILVLAGDFGLEVLSGYSEIFDLGGGEESGRVTEGATEGVTEGAMKGATEGATEGRFRQGRPRP